MTFLFKVRLLRIFLSFCAILSLSDLLGQTTNITYSSLFCSGSTADLATALPTGRQYTCVPRASTTVQGAVSITNSATLNQTLNLANTGTAAANIVFDITDVQTPTKKFVLTVPVSQIPRLNTANWVNTGCGTISNLTLASTTVVGVPTDGWKWSRPDTLNTPAVSNTNNVINDRVINLKSDNVPVPYTIEMTGANGCKNTQELSYVVIPTPDIKTPIIYDTICSETGIKPFIPSTQLANDVYYIWPTPTAAGLPE